ncbi:MAG: hypothetical protein U5K72_15630 [Balneolaceae bacterium]|nr:hypothetical protein [Balneolaceae bacterium]
MKNDKNQTNPTPWQRPEIKILTISSGTQQNGPKDPPDFESQQS